MSWSMIYFDDQSPNIEALQDLLAEKITVHGCTDATKYEQIISAHNPHIILIDVHMPGLDGYALYERITENQHYNGCPIMFISGDQSDENKFRSHDQGGIDFLSRDLVPEELEVRLISKIRFHQQSSTLLTLGNLSIDLNELTVFIDGKFVDVTLLEMRLISALVRKYPEIKTRTQLIEKIWGDGVKPGTVNTHITNLRPKIENWDYTIKVREDNVLIVPKSKA